MGTARRDKLEIMTEQLQTANQTATTERELGERVLRNNERLVFENQQLLMELKAQRENGELAKLKEKLAAMTKRYDQLKEIRQEQNTVVDLMKKKVEEFGTSIHYNLYFISGNRIKSSSNFESSSVVEQNSRVGTVQRPS